MSTNSGKVGFCRFCSHFMNSHRKASSSKCTKCQNRILVCQAGVYNEGAGWRLCDVPCGCGSRYYPSTAKQADSLVPTEHASTHPLYESPPRDEDKTFASASYLYPKASNTSTGNPTCVDVTINGHYVQFYDQNNEFITTLKETWRQTRIDYQGVEHEAWQVNDNKGLLYFTWTLDMPDSQGVAAEQSESSLGKQVAYTPQPTSHGCTLSEESIHPVKWDNAQLEANFVASAMAGLTIGSSSSQQVEGTGSRERVRCFVQLDSKGRVIFKVKAGGDEVKSLRESWVQVEGGFVFDSKTYGRTFFVKEIKPAKK